MIIEKETCLISKKHIFTYWVVTGHLLKVLIYNGNKLKQEISNPMALSKKEIKDLLKSKWYKVNLRGTSLILEIPENEVREGENYFHYGLHRKLHSTPYKVITKANFHRMEEDGICPSCNKFANKGTACFPFYYLEFMD